MYHWYFTKLQETKKVNQKSTTKYHYTTASTYKIEKQIIVWECNKQRVGFFCKSFSWVSNKLGWVESWEKCELGQNLCENEEWGKIIFQKYQLAANN